ncbi:MAG: hypothetical protein VKN13_06495 [Cyanobacteriota bacterium]|nr:hypothetical protein [Cyanobacteriota bacterium]
MAQSGLSDLDRYTADVQALLRLMASPAAPGPPHLLVSASRAQL